MCMFYSELRQACNELLEKNESFDVIQVRDRIRELSSDQSIAFRDVKYELYTYFEQGGLPGFVIGTKTIEKDDYTVQSVIEYRLEKVEQKPKGSVFIEYRPNKVEQKPKRSIFDSIVKNEEVDPNNSETGSEEVKTAPKSFWSKWLS